jgi:hypothetical protein
MYPEDGNERERNKKQGDCKMQNTQELRPMFEEEQDRFIVTDLGAGTWEDWKQEQDHIGDIFQALDEKIERLERQNANLQLLALVAAYCRDIAILIGIIYFFAR